MNPSTTSDRATPAAAPDLGSKPAGLDALLSDHHAEIESQCLELMGAAFVDDPPTLARRWSVFEHELLEHMAAEEELVIPAYQRVDPEQAQELRADHILLRDLLEKVALDVELHTIRIARLKDLVALLRSHAQREEQSLYPWTQNHLPAVRRQQLLSRIRPRQHGA